MIKTLLLLPSYDCAPGETNHLFDHICSLPRCKVCSSLCSRKIMNIQLVDLSGLTVTCNSPKAIDLCNTVLQAMYSCSNTEGFLPSLNQALQLDPDFILARCMTVRLLLNTSFVITFTCSYFFTITQVTLQLEEGTPSDPVGRFFLKLGK